jgi:hypothetical protein
LHDAELVFLCTAHGSYRTDLVPALSQNSGLRALFDACNFFRKDEIAAIGLGYAGIGRGTRPPTREFLEFVYQEFRTMERGLSNEVLQLVDFLNDSYASDPFNRVDFAEVQRLAGTCVTGCDIVAPGPVADACYYDGFSTRLADLARAAAGARLHAC